MNETELVNDIITAAQYIDNQQSQQAFNILEKYIPHNPQLSYFWNVLGHAFRGITQFNEAYDSFLKATQLQPSIAESFYNLGRLEGEMHSFHRLQDIRRTHGKNFFNQHPQQTYTCFNEQQIIQTLINEINPSHLTPFVIDIGAGDGMTYSNSYKLLKDSQWKGISIEPNNTAFTLMAQSHANLDCTLVKCYANPDNILQILQSHDTPQTPGFLSLDIDSYDYFVLEKILSHYKPSIICTEINEYMPPPICWALKYKKDLPFQAFGQSIQIVHNLLQKHNYSILWLEYNNVFAVHNTLIHHIKSYSPLTPQEAFKKGLTDRSDWKLKLPWNIDFRSQVFKLQNDTTTLYKIIKDNFIQNEDDYVFYIDQ